SMVLLKNDGLLPLKPGIKNIVVVGPLADQARPLIGNYSCQPTHIVSILDGLHAECPNAAITFVSGTQFLRADGTPVPDSLLTTPDGRTESNVNLTDKNLPPEIAGRKTFGGLSYTTFSYSGLNIPTQAVSAGQTVGADATVTNSGKVPGDEVVQVYLKFPDVKGAPQIALRGFQRIHLEPGTSQKVHFDLKPRDLGIVTEDGLPIIAQGDYT